MRIEKKPKKIEVLFIAVSITVFIHTLHAQQTKDFAEPVEKKFNEWQPPEKIMDAMGLEAGMVIGEIGAGGGRFTVWFANRVGDNGRVYANDIDMGALLHLKKRCKKHGFANVIARIGRGTDPNIPTGTLDIAFMIGTYHHLEKPVEMIRNITPTLKPDGELIIVENDPEKSGWTSHTTPKNVLTKQVEQAGLVLIKINASLQRDNIYFFKPKR